jgi:hypothetical protein
VGLLFRIGLFLALLALVAKLFRRRAWGATCGHPGAHWAKHWHHHGHRPPCCVDEDQPSEEQVAKVKPDAQADGTEM